MLELIVIAIVATAVATCLVWLWRKLTEFKGVSLVSLSGNNNAELKLTQQQGYVSLPGARAHNVMLSKQRTGGSRKPWGW